MFKRNRIKACLLSILLIIFCVTACKTNNAPTPQPESYSKPPSGIQKPLTDENIDNEINYIETPMTTPAPNPEPSVAVDEAIGYFQTTLLDQSKSRLHNITLASEKIDGFVLQPGQVFSFNEVVGQRLPERGFKKAIVLIKGKRGYEEGGGICQISSTMFNAAEKAGMEIVERHSHSKDVHYLPLGRDAAIVYGEQDFKFKNTRDFPVKLHAYIEGDKMVTSITRAQ
jgi:vancomycin resistance protein YoaR